MDQKRTENLTRSGLLPDNTHEPYTISTDDMVTFLQKQINAVIVATNQNLPEGTERFPDVRIKAYNYHLGSKFYPLVIFLPQEAIYKKNRKRKNGNNVTKDGRISIRADVNAETDDYGGGVRLHSFVYETIKPYMYPNGGKAFNCRNVQEQNGIVRANVPKIINLCKPCTVKMNNGKVAVMVALDVYHVMYDMLAKKQDNRRYTVLLHKAKRIKDGVYRFSLTRSVMNGKGDRKGAIDNEFKALARKLSSGGGLE